MRQRCLRTCSIASGLEDLSFGVPAQSPYPGAGSPDLSQKPEQRPLRDLRSKNRGRPENGDRLKEVCGILEAE
jgi:hypothetical protein